MKNLDKPKCMWCGGTYEMHLDQPLPSGAVPRMPCLGLKSGFKEETVTDNTTKNLDKTYKNERGEFFKEHCGWEEDDEYKIRVVTSSPEDVWHWHIEAQQRLLERVRDDLKKELMVMSCSCQFRVEDKLQSLQGELKEKD